MTDIEAQEEAHNFEIYSSSSKSGIQEFANPRIGFVRKVYGIISCQLLLTTVMVYLAQTSWKSFYQSHNALPHTLFFFSMFGSFVTMCLVACYTSLSRTVPTNYIILGLFTLCEAYMVSYFTTFCDPEDVVLASLLTCALTFTLTLYAFTTKGDFSVFGASLWILCWGLLMISLLLSLMFFWNPHMLRTLNIVVSVLMVCLYGFYLVFDTQVIMGGGQFELTLDDYILGAIIIYVDIIVLFMRILSVLASMRRN